MRTEVAKTAGFCFGVNRAAELVTRLVDEGKNVCMLGPVIHNPRFISGLVSRGARVIERPSQAPAGSIVVIRSHGVPQETCDELALLGLEVADATCPYVAKIHRIVKDASSGGAAVLIAGDPDHPEVKGIRGHCAGASFVFRNLSELRQMAADHPEFALQALIAVAQTTFNASEWRKCDEFIKKVYTNCHIFDTICSATSVRQQEATELAAKADLMVVVGGRDSSNTQKLFAICSAVCPSYLVEGPEELPVEQLKRPGLAGVTAGASTPACIIKEVLNTMSGLDNIDNEDIDFAEALEKSFKTISTDERVRGVVAGISPNEVQVDLGTKHAGYIPLSELSDDPSVKPEQMLSVGDEIETVVLRVNDQDGTVMLSKKRVDAMKSWDDIVKANAEDATMQAVVTDVIKGGLLASVKGVKVFIPASQSGVPRSGNMETLLRQTVGIKIIEINEGRRRAVGSIRAVLKEQKKVLEEAFWASVEVNKEYTGKVKSLTSYGAFVDLGGVDGMVHVSELSWGRIKHPSEVVNVGDTVRVFVKDFNPETKKVSLGYCDKGPNPWDTFKEKYHVGDIITAKVVSIMPFGCFAQIMPGVDGLVHISQMAEKRVVRPQDVVSIEQDIRVKIIEIEDERKRISLSMKEAAEAEAAAAPEAEATDETQKPADSDNA